MYITCIDREKREKGEWKKSEHRITYNVTERMAIKTPCRNNIFSIVSLTVVLELAHYLQRYLTSNGRKKLFFERESNYYSSYCKSYPLLSNQCNLDFSFISNLCDGIYCLLWQFIKSSTSSSLMKYWSWLIVLRVRLNIKYKRWSEIL